MKKIRREAKVGIFALITLAALYWGVNFLRGRDLFNRYNNYYATYDVIAGVQKSSAITIKGFKVGVVSNISYNPSVSEKIVVEMNIRSKFKIPENSKARVISGGILSGKEIIIEYGDSERYLEDRDTLRSEMDPGLLEMAGPELEMIKQRVSNLMNDLTRTLDNVNGVLEANSANITSTIENLADITSSLNRVVSSEEGTLKEVVANINTLSQTLENSSQNIENIIGNVETFTDSLSKADIPLLVNNLSITMEKLNGTLAKVNDGKGTLGKLVHDEELYNSLSEASLNLSVLLEDLQKNPERYVQFSLFGGGKKK